jgi:hypothetical protein
LGNKNPTNGIILVASAFCFTLQISQNICRLGTKKFVPFPSIENNPGPYGTHFLEWVIIIFYLIPSVFE